jgi:hypothetical protein
MTKDERIASYKYSVLQHAREHKNIAHTPLKFTLTLIPVSYSIYSPSTNG